MMLRKIGNINGLQSSVVLTLLMLCQLAFGEGLLSFVNSDAITDEENTFLWEIRKDGRQLGALFGTFHVGAEESTIPDKAKAYLAQSDQLITENVIVFQTAEEEMATVLATLSAFKPSTESIAERFSAKYATLLKTYLLSKGIPEASQDTIANEMLFAMLAMDLGEGYSPEYGAESLIEQYVNNIKSRANFVNIGLESVAESLQLLKVAIAATVKLEIENFFDYREMIQASSQAMIRYYANNDAQGLLQTVAKLETEIPMTEADRGRSQAMMKQLNEDRNHNWMPTLVALLNTKDDHHCFIAVGALHLFGEEGLIALLRKEGFELLPVLF